MWAREAKEVIDPFEELRTFAKVGISLLAVISATLILFLILWASDRISTRGRERRTQPRTAQF